MENQNTNVGETIKPTTNEETLLLPQKEKQEMTCISIICWCLQIILWI